jgi:UDP-glucose 4-epimerase
MTVLVTGEAGYSGSHMVFELLDAGEQVVVLDDLAMGFRQAAPAGAPLIVGDTGDQALASHLIGEYDVRAIIHFAASQSFRIRFATCRPIIATTLRTHAR